MQKMAFITVIVLAFALAALTPKVSRAQTPEIAVIKVDCAKGTPLTSINTEVAGNCWWDGSIAKAMENSIKMAAKGRKIKTVTPIPIIGWSPTYGNITTSILITIIFE